MPPEVTILIPTRDGWPHLEQCLPSLERLSYSKDSYQVVIVDNGSTDNTRDHVERLFPRVKVLHNKENLGFAPALSRAAALFDAPYLAFLNNDTRVEPDWLAHLINALEPRESRNERAVAACGAILNWDQTGVQFFGGHINFVGKAFHKRPSMDELAAAPAVQPSFYPCGAGMVIHRESFLDSGGFDEDYFMIYEDVDLGWRLNLLGLQTLLVRDARISHREGASLSELDYPNKALWWERNALWTIFKNYSDSFLECIWPAALALAFKRDQILLEAGRQEEFEAHHRGVAAAIESLDRARQKRDWVQKRRQVSDKALLQFFPQPFRTWAYAQPHYELLAAGRYDEYRDECLERFEVRCLFDLKGG